MIGKSQKYFLKQQEYLGHVNGQVEEIYGGHNIVKVFGREKQAIKEFEKENEELYKSGWRSQFLSGLMHPLMNFVGNVGYVAVAILGGYFAVKGRITVGNIQSFIQYNKFSSLIAPGLTSIKQDINEICKQVVNCLFDKNNGGGTIMIEPTLSIKGSVKTC